jgi:ribosome-binding factor A
MERNMKWIQKIYIAILVVITAAGCKPEIDVPAPKAGGADFSEYLAIGNSLSAGVSDGGLYLEVQQQSFPALIAQQIKQINPSLEFNQPDMPPGNGSGHLKLRTLDLANSIFDFIILPPDATWTNKIPGTYQNLGIPGMRVRDITVNGYGANVTQGNPYFYRILGEQDANKSYMDIVSESNATFFTCWLGSNDVLGYATSGGVDGVSGLPGTGINGLTPVDDFEASYDALINLMMSKGASGFLLTIPDVTNIPFFTSISWNALVMNSQQAEAATAGYQAMIDPQVEAGVKTATINLVATDTVLSVAVLPDLADTTVFLQIYQQAIEEGADQATALQLAQDYVDSPEGQAAIAFLEVVLNTELPAHLLGQPTSPELDPLFAAIDEQLATNSELQQAIAQTIDQITQAYDAGYLPELEAAVSQQTAAQISALKEAGIYPTFNAGSNGFVIEVPVTQTNPLGIRQMVEGELVLFSAALGDELGPDKAAMPKPDEIILTLEEISNIKEYTDQFNDIINGYSSNSVGVFNSDDLLEMVNAGAFIDGVEITGDYIQGGVFSLDAIHLTPRGYAIVASSLIQAINQKFGSTIPPVKISDYRAVILP